MRSFKRLILAGLLPVLLLACDGRDAEKQTRFKQSLKSAVERAEAVRHLNSFIWLDETAVMAQADALLAARKIWRKPPLWGVIYVAKDNIDTDFMPTSGGTAALAGQTPPHSAPVVDALQEAGAILLGKTNMHELALGITSNNGTFGAVRNPYDSNHIAGGSSGGTAVAIAAGVVDVGLGTDTGGSMRIPAALTGIYGFRPTMGRYASGGVVPLSATRDTVGVMAKNMDILMRFDSVLSGDNSTPKVKPMRQWRIGVPHAYFHDDLHPDTRAALDNVLALLEAQGVTLIREDMDNIGALNAAVSFPVVLYEIMRDLPAYLTARGQADFAAVRAQSASPDVKGLLEAISGQGAVPEAAYGAAIAEHRPALQAAYADYFRRHQLDAVLVMTTPAPAIKIGEDETFMLNGRAVPTFPTFIRNTDPPSNAGIAALSMPVGVSRQGLPIGAELVGLAGSDRALLHMAAMLEKILPPVPAP